MIATWPPPAPSSSRPSRLAMLVAMVWILAFINLFHLQAHAWPQELSGQASTMASLQLPAAHLGEASLEAACALCVWHSQTPYSPPAPAAHAPCALPGAERLPANLSALERAEGGLPRTRAPPSPSRDAIVTCRAPGSSLEP